MNESAFQCPYCLSADVRRSRRQGLGEIPGMFLGIYPFRCLACGERFFGSIWMRAKREYARCPKCLRLDVLPWVRTDAHLTRWSRFRLALGAHSYRCVPCRRFFVSFRSRLLASPDAVEAVDVPESAN